RVRTVTGVQTCALPILYTLVLAALRWPVGSVTRAATVVFVLGLAATGWFLVAAFQRCGSWKSGLGATLLVVCCPLVLETKGMESVLFLALAAGVLWAAATDRDVALGVLGALLV